jgi:hypothetical protein
MNHGLSSKSNAVGLTRENELVVGNELVHIGDVHCLINDNVFRAQGLSGGNLDIREWDNIRFRVLKEKRAIEALNRGMVAAVALTDGNHMQMHRVWCWICHYLLVELERSSIDAVLRDVGLCHVEQA